MQFCFVQTKFDNIIKKEKIDDISYSSWIQSDTSFQGKSSLYAVDRRVYHPHCNEDFEGGD